MTSLPSKILSLARAGNPVRAWRLFGELGLGGVTDDARILTLKGRLLKDLAWRAEGGERAQLFRRASEAYLAAHALTPDSYPLINAAALALLAGDTAQSHELARQVIGLIENNPGEGETPYWREATRAEAQLLLGDEAGAQASLEAGIDKLPQAWEDHARTIEQFSEIIAEQGDDPSWLDHHRPPCSLHFSGLIGLDPEAPGLREEIDDAIVSLKPGFAFGALAAGADILIAEALLNSGAQLHITLPGTVEEFRNKSVAAFGAKWVPRYDALVARSDRVDCLPFDLEQDLPFAQCIEAASLVSMGQAIRNAEVLSSRAHALTVVAAGEAERSPISQWRASGRELQRIETKRVAAGSRSLGMVSEEDGTPHCKALMAVSGIEESSVRGLLERPGLGSLATGPKNSAMGNPAACIAAILQARQAHEGARAALLIGFYGPNGPDRSAIGRLLHLSDAATPGQVLTDYQTAMIARVLLPNIRIEEAGELTSLSGPIRLWSLIP